MSADTPSLQAGVLKPPVNPLTYAAEGMRYAMIPVVNGHAPDTLAIGWVILALSGTFIACLIGGMLTFRQRVVS